MTFDNHPNLKKYYEMIKVTDLLSTYNERIGHISAMQDYPPLVKSSPPHWKDSPPAYDFMKIF